MPSPNKYFATVIKISKTVFLMVHLLFIPDILRKFIVQNMVLINIRLWKGKGYGEDKYADSARNCGYC